MFHSSEHIWYTASIYMLDCATYMLKHTSYIIRYINIYCNSQSHICYTAVNIYDTRHEHICYIHTGMYLNRVTICCKNMLDLVTIWWHNIMNLVRICTTICCWLCNIYVTSFQHITTQLRYIVVTYTDQIQHILSSLAAYMLPTPRFRPWWWGPARI